MSDFSLTLGPVAFAGFELPSSITLGGRQRLAIHKLPGGLRVIDALGPDPADLAWSRHLHRAGLPPTAHAGLESGCAARWMRWAGLPLLLAWDAFFYTVVIESFEADYRSPWWIPYRLSCAVLRDEAAVLVTAALSLAPTIAADLASAGLFASAAALAVSKPGATSAGTASYAAATARVNTTVSSLNSQIAAAEPALHVPDVPSAMAAAGQLAQLTAAHAYTARAARNLSAAST